MGNLYRTIGFFLVASVGACSDDTASGGSAFGQSDTSSGSEGGPGSNATTSAGSSSPTTTAAATSTSNGDTASGSGSAGESDETSGPPAVGCDKIDFLFVVNNTPSMAAEQQKLIAAFPDFFAALQAEVQPAADAHIMVVDTDACTPPRPPRLRCAPAGG